MSDQETVRFGLVRHGTSEWNAQGRFTGWVDIGITERGQEEAYMAGVRLRAAGRFFDVCHTSLLRRAIHSTALVLEGLDEPWVPIHNAWRLNERHYGALQGLTHAEVAARLGEQQVQAWRRGFDVRPPPAGKDDTWQKDIVVDRRYQSISIPSGESSRDTQERSLVYWHERIVPDLRAGINTLACGHGNTWRGWMAYLEGLEGDAAIATVKVPNAVPIIYELHRSDLSVVRKEILD